MIETQFKEGDIVRYAPEWCRSEEHRLLHVITELRFIPGQDDFERYYIKTINSNLALGSSETVDGYMLEPTGFNIFDFDNPTKDEVVDAVLGESKGLKGKKSRSK